MIYPKRATKVVFVFESLCETDGYVNCVCFVCVTVGAPTFYRCAVLMIMDTATEKVLNEHPVAGCLGALQ